MGGWVGGGGGAAKLNEWRLRKGRGWMVDVSGKGGKVLV